MQSTTLSFENMHNYGELFANVLRARKQSFIPRSKWNLPDAVAMEYDQYDTPASRWLAVHEDGAVLGGLRLTPTTARCGIYSYMIRDAQNGLLDHFPTDLLDYDAPVAPGIWEITRGFVAANVPAARRQGVRDRLIGQLADTALELHIDEILTLTPANWRRWAKRSRLNIAPAGPRTKMGGADYQVVSIRFSPAATDMVLPLSPLPGQTHLSQAVVHA